MSDVWNDNIYCCMVNCCYIIMIEILHMMSCRQLQFLKAYTECTVLPEILFLATYLSFHSLGYPYSQKIVYTKCSVKYTYFIVYSIKYPKWILWQFQNDSENSRYCCITNSKKMIFTVHVFTYNYSIIISLVY